MNFFIGILESIDTDDIRIDTQNLSAAVLTKTSDWAFWNSKSV